MSFFIRLEPFAGGEISEAVQSLPLIAQRMGVWVRANLNGIDVLASPHDSPNVLWANYLKAWERGVDFVSANVIPQGGPSPSLSGDGNE